MIFVYINLQIVGIDLDNSDTTAIYLKAIKQSTKFSKIVNILLLKFFPSCISLPPLSISIFDYFVSDLGSAVLKLPFPIW